jgi:hypothetical protein
VSATLDEALELREAVADPPVIRPDGLIGLHIIRPGIGKGRGRHLYEAEMLQREAAAGRFKGWKMYLDHQSPEAKRAAAGLPRSIRDLAGVVREAWWDPRVPADRAAGHGQGAVVGLARVNRFMRELVEDIPEAIGTSISAQATNVRPKMIGSQQVWLVEGIRPRGSVDFVTDAGAGGKVAALMEHALEESWFDDEEEARSMLEGLEAQELAETLLAERPDVVSVLIEARNNDPDGDDDMDNSMPGPGGEDDDDEKGTRKRSVRETKEVVPTVGEINEALEEALQTDEFKTAVAAQVEEAFSAIVAPKLAELIEAVLTDERELLAADAGATSARLIEVRDLRDEAHSMINASRLPETLKQELREEYEIVDGKPTTKLDVVEAEIDGEKKPAVELLKESVTADIARKRAVVEEITPTRVRGQGPRREATLTEGEQTEQKKPEDTSTGSVLTDHLLAEARFGEDELSEDLWADLPS